MIRYLCALDFVLGADKICEVLNDCVKENLIKKAEETNNYDFLVLEENEEKVKSILKDDYNKILNGEFIDWIKSELVESSHSMEIENIYGDSIEITSDDMFDLIYDDIR